MGGAAVRNRSSLFFLGHGNRVSARSDGRERVRADTRQEMSRSSREHTSRRKTGCRDTRANLRGRGFIVSGSSSGGFFFRLVNPANHKISCAHSRRRTLPGVTPRR